MPSSPGLKSENTKLKWPAEINYDSLFSCLPDIYKTAFTAINTVQYVWHHSKAENDSNLIFK